MFTKSSNNSRTDRGSPKQTLLKKKARSTILSVLSKRQTQEKSFLSNKNQPDRQSWSSDSTISDPDIPKTAPKPSTKPHEGPPKPLEGPPKPAHQYPSRKVSDSTPKSVYDYPPKSVHQYPSRTISDSVPIPVREYEVQSYAPHSSHERSPKPEYATKKEQFTRKTSFEQKSPVQLVPISPSKDIPKTVPEYGTKILSKSPSKSPPKTAPKPLRSPPLSISIPKAEVRSPLETGSEFVVKSCPGEAPPTPDRPYSVIIQNTARYPPPKPRTSSADVTPHTVTVNSIRVYEATPKMVEADPEIISRWDRYPLRDPPIMSPTSAERFDWETNRRGVLEGETREPPRALALTGIPVHEDPATKAVPRAVPSQARKTSSSSDEVETPKLVSDSVKVSIPFGLRGVPPSPTKESNSWASRVSVCVPFQVSEGEAIKVSPEMLKADEKLALEEAQHSQLKAIAESEESEITQSPTRTSTSPAIRSRPGQQLYRSVSEPTMRPLTGQQFYSSVTEPAMRSPTGQQSEPAIHSVYTHPGSGRRKSSLDSTDGLQLVMVRRGPVEEEVQMPVKIDERVVHGIPDSNHSDAHDGVTKHGKYSVVYQSRKVSDGVRRTSLTRTVDKTPTKTRKAASPRSSPKQGRKATAASTPAGKPSQKTPEKPQTKTSTVTKAVTTKAVLGKSKGDEGTMLKARIRQLEGERDSLQEKLSSMEGSISSFAILEKEKLRLQSQMKDAAKDLEQARQQLSSANEATSKVTSEKAVLQLRHNKLLVEMEKTQVMSERMEDEKDILIGEKNNLINKNKRLQREIDSSLEDVDRLSDDNATLVAENKTLKNRLNDLLYGLKEVKNSVAKVREENQLLHDEIVHDGAEMMGFMKKCVGGLEMVVERMKEPGNMTYANEAVTSSCYNHVDSENQRLVEELDESKDRIDSLLGKVEELEKLKEINKELINNRDASEANAERVSFSHVEDEHEGCPGCIRLRHELNSLSEDYDAQKIKIEELEVKIEDLNEDKDDLQQESKYLKQVLSYREDMKSVQVSQKATRQLQRLESNLEDAEKKCKDLESEVSQLYSQKQSLLMNLLKQHEDEVAAQENAEGDEDEEDDEEDNEDDLSEDDFQENARSSFGEGSLTRTPRSSLKRGAYGGVFSKRSLSMESDFSSGTSFYDSDSSSDSDIPSDLEDASTKLKDYVYTLKDDLKHFKSSFKESNMERKSMARRLEKSSDDFKTMMQRMQKLDAENVQLRDRIKNERKTYKAKIRTGEQKLEKLKESLQETEEEKQALIRCMNPGNTLSMETQSTARPESPLPLDDMSRLIAKAQAFAREEQAARGEDVDSSSSESEYEGKEEPEETPEPAGEEQVSEREERSSSSSEEERSPVHSEMSRPWMTAEPKQKERRSLMDGICEEGHEDTKQDDEAAIKEDEEEEDEEDDIIKPPPHARFLQRKASIASINMDRVCREKQHLEDEVASLSKYLNRSISRRRHSTVEMPKTPPLGAMKTLESLLQKSDTELKESSAKIARLQELNADQEDRIKDSEMLQDDLRKAVVIANNFAMEEREKSTALEEEREELLKQIETLKKENARLKGRKSKGKSFKSRIASEEDLADSEGGEVESDFFSSRHSSIASVASDVSRGSDLDGMDGTAGKMDRDSNSNLID